MLNHLNSCRLLQLTEGKVTGNHRAQQVEMSVGKRQMLAHQMEEHCWLPYVPVHEETVLQDALESKRICRLSSPKHPNCTQLIVDTFSGISVHLSPSLCYPVSRWDHVPIRTCEMWIVIG